MSIFSRLNEDTGGNAPSADRFWVGMAVIAFALVMAYGSYWLYTYESTYLDRLIAADRALIVFSEYSAGLLFGPIFLIATALIVLIRICYRDVFKRPLHRFTEILQLGLYAAMVIGLVLLLTGGLFVNPSWSSKFQANGYTECSNFVLRFNKNFLNSAWVKDPSFCLDDELHQILHENHSRRGFEQASRYLERTYRQFAGELTRANPGLSPRHFSVSSGGSGASSSCEYCPTATIAGH